MRCNAAVALAARSGQDTLPPRSRQREESQMRAPMITSSALSRSDLPASPRPLQRVRRFPWEDILIVLAIRARHQLPLSSNLPRDNALPLERSADSIEHNRRILLRDLKVSRPWLVDCCLPERGRRHGCFTNVRCALRGISEGDWKNATVPCRARRQRTAPTTAGCRPVSRVAANACAWPSSSVSFPHAYIARFPEASDTMARDSDHT